MPREPLEIIGSFNKQRISELDPERTINMFEFIDPLGKSPRALFSTPGIEQKIRHDGTGQIRMMFVFGSYLYYVYGNQFSRLDVSFVSTPLGNLSTSIGYIGVDANTFQISFVDGQKGYIYDTITGLFTVIDNPYFPNAPIDITALDNIFIVGNRGTNTFYLSEINQGLTYGLLSTIFTIAAPPTDTLILTTAQKFQTGVPISFTVSGGSLPSPLVTGQIYYAIYVDNTHIKVSLTANGTPITLTTTGSGTFTVTNNGQLQTANITTHPGTILAVRSLHRRLFIFSQSFTEIWEPAGSADFYFRRNNSFLIELGTVGAQSIKTGFDKMFFLSQDKDGLGSIMMVNGVQAIPISTPAIDYQLQNYVNISDCDVSLYRENGTIWYRVNFTTDNHTYVYNVSQSNQQKLFWHEEQMLNGDRHVTGINANFFGNNYFGDYKNPVIYYSDDSLLSNNGEAIPRIRITKNFIRNDFRGRRVNRIQLDVVQGLVADEQTNIAPVMFLSVSKDGGNTYGARLPSFMGKLAQRTFRSVWRKIATFRRGQGMVLKYECFDKIKFTILGCVWDYTDLQE